MNISKTDSINTFQLYVLYEIIKFPKKKETSLFPQHSISDPMTSSILLSNQNIQL